jgi:hypothetical protein
VEDFYNLYMFHMCPVLLRFTDEGQDELYTWSDGRRNSGLEQLLCGPLEDIDRNKGLYSNALKPSGNYMYHPL